MLLAPQHNEAIVTDTRKVIVHINNSNPPRLRAALDETEALLTNYKSSNQQIEVEVIANKQGVDLLRAITSTSIC